MGFAKREPRLCPECGCEMIFGDLIVADRGPSPVWESRAKYAYSIRNIFGKQKTVYRSIRHTLMDSFPEDLYEEYAWYCPDCGIVDVRFRVSPVEIITAVADDDEAEAE